MSNYEIRKMAREKLGNNTFGNTWLMALVAYIIYAVVTGALSYFAIGAIFVGCLTYGYNGIHLDLVRGKSNIDLADCFSGFRMFSQTLVLGLLQYIFIFLSVRENACIAILFPMKKGIFRNISML